MDDLDLDRELRAALDVTPSPDFVARVRVAVQKQSSASRFPRWLVPASAAACIAVGATIGPRMMQSSNHPREPRFGPRTIHSVLHLPATPTLGAPTLARAAIHVPPPLQPANMMDERVTVDVLVSAATKQAFEELVTSVQQGRFTATFVETPDSAPWVLTELVVPPITIQPLKDPSDNDPLTPIEEPSL